VERILKHNVNNRSKNVEMARGAVYSYLKGTAEYEKWRLEEIVRASSVYRQQRFTSFRSHNARVIRDEKLLPAHVNFMVQAFRYRGKANYRDAIYLSYGRDRIESLAQFVIDLADVAGAFCLMTGHYVSRRVIRNDWTDFVDDIKRNIRFDMPFDPVEI
jgi:hypothetical protein